jgi:hypothetical protein
VASRAEDLREAVLVVLILVASAVRVALTLAGEVLKICLEKCLVADAHDALVDAGQISR